jgi:23S rRNA (pseudouridine1915-N3)-methyltransferase
LTVKITLVAVGQRQPRWSEDAVDDFVKRFPPGFAVTIKEVRTETRRGQPLERILAAEADRLRAAIPAGGVVVALDERGQDWTSTQFADQLGKWRDASEHVVFMIGGPDGLAPELKRAARMLLRLSSMTLPHALARLVLVEQLYRAWSLLASHPYHRA